MNALKPLILKRSSKQNRTHKVLLGLVEFYLKTGKPVGSNTLKEDGFGDLSSATIRNYFSALEEEGYLTQQHISGGRIPTNLALREYAKEYKDATQVSPENSKRFDEISDIETREIASYLQRSSEMLSEITQLAVFLSAPRFDQDYIVGMKLVPIDSHRCLCVIVTDFGIIKTEVLSTEVRLSAFAAKKMEAYFNWRLTGHNKPHNFSVEEEALAQKMYNEVIVRYVVGYSNFIDAELYRTGFSRLLTYPEFHDTNALSATLSFFENMNPMRLLIKECCKLNQLNFWVGDDLSPYATTIPNCAIICVPYYINQNIAGAIGVLGPTRIPYRELFGIMRAFSRSISEALTRNLYKFKITFRQPHHGAELRLMDQSRQLLLENKGLNYEE